MRKYYLPIFTVNQLSLSSTITVVTTDAEDAIQFDDLAALNAKASEEFGPWGPEVDVSQALINQFADMTDDHQWIHVDVERAQNESPFGVPIAHGFLTLSLLPRLAVSPIRVRGHKSGTNCGAEKLRFSSPVPAGSNIQARSRLCRAERHRHGTLITAEVEIGVVGTEKPAVIYRMQYLYS
jgi:acyl dehydratase